MKTAHRPPRAVAAVLALALSLSAVSCRATQAKSEDQARAALRALVRGGQLPGDERQVAQIQSDYAGTRAGALARVLRARVKLNAGDAAGAAQLLDAREIGDQTKIGDYALLLRARALEKQGRRAEARAAYEKLGRDYPRSAVARDAALRGAELIADESASGAAAVPTLLAKWRDVDDARALLLSARAYEKQSDRTRALAAYRRLYFFTPASAESAEAATAMTARLGSSLAPATPEEALARAARLHATKNFNDSSAAYAQAFALFPTLSTPEHKLGHGAALAGAKRYAEAIAALLAVPSSAPQWHVEALYQLTDVYAAGKQWAQARGVADQMRRLYPDSDLSVRAFVEVGQAAKEAKNNAEALNFFRAAIGAYPARAETAPAQFEIAWAAHEAKNYQESARLLIDHVANYADKNTDYRGRAGYWAARDAERAGRAADARALYRAMEARYGATWYGYLSKQRLAKMSAGNASATADATVERAAANLKTVTVAQENAGPEEDRAVAAAAELGDVGLDEWALDELNAAQKRVPSSPRVNLALAQIYRAQNDNLAAFNALRRSFPDYAQMNPEELTREQWDVFYPLEHWDVIVAEARSRSLDPHQVAGLIRQESVFNTRARSSARAYGLMQLIVPTGQAMARKYGVDGPVNEQTLYEPRLNIRLGAAYMRDQLDRFGRIEYLAAAYNAGPGRAVAWRASLPAEIDDWVEAVPFRETRGYVQGVVRNMLQYERLYDDRGKFRPEIGSRPVRPAGDNGDATRPRRATGEE